MITIHSIIVRFSSRFNRWYAYDSSGNLIYLDFSFCDVTGLESGKEYEVLGKVVKPSQEGPLFVLMVAAFTPKEQDPVPSEVKL